MAIKLQLILMDLSSTIWWSTVIELFLFIYGLFISFVDVKNTAVFWLFSFHVARALLGLLIIKKMPTVSDMITQLHQIQ